MSVDALNSMYFARTWRAPPGAREIAGLPQCQLAVLGHLATRVRVLGPSPPGLASSGALV
eukprot:4860126-Pyramimonas_sp.AAC.1